MNQLNTEFEQLLSGLCDGRLTDEQMRQLGERIATNEADRLVYVQYLDLHASLQGEAAFADVTESLGNLPALAIPAMRTSLRVRNAFIIVASLAALLLLMTWLPNLWQPPVKQVVEGPGPVAVPPAPLTRAPWAQVVDAVGTVELRNESGTSRSIRTGDSIAQGETLSTGSDESFAVVELASGSRLLLSPESQLRLTSDLSMPHHERLILSAGVLQANVPKLAPEFQLFVVTSQAEISVRDTNCLVSAPDAAATAVETSSGSASVTRIADGQKTDVPAGFFTVAMQDEREFAVRPVEQLPTQPHAHLPLERARALVYLGSERFVAASGELTTVFDRNQKLPLHSSVRLKESSWQVVASTDGSAVVRGDRDGKFELFDALSGSKIATLDTEIKNALAVAVTPQGAEVILSEQMGWRKSNIHFWNPTSGEKVSTIEGPGYVRTFALSADGKTLALASDKTRDAVSHHLEFWDVATRTRRLQIPISDRPLRVLAFSHDGSQIAGANDRGAVFVWECETGNQLTSRSSFEGWTQPITALAFAPGSQLLAAGSNNGRVRLWNVNA